MQCLVTGLAELESGSQHVKLCHNIPSHSHLLERQYHYAVRWSPSNHRNTDPNSFQYDVSKLYRIYISPSDCAALSQAQNNSESAYQSSLSAVATNVSIATDLSSVIVGSETTTYSYGQGEAPIITLNSTRYSPYLSVTTYTPGSSSSFTYYEITTSGTYTDSVMKGDSFTIYGYVPEPATDGLACSTVTNSAHQCGACTVFGGQVEMQYFPVQTTRASSDQCASPPATPVVTTCPLGTLTSSYHPGSTGINGHCEEWVPCPYAYVNTSTTDSGPYFVSAGNTYYQNRVYVSLDSAYASNSCGPVGGTHSASVFTLATSQVYSVPFNFSNCAMVGAQFDFANLNPEVPFAAWEEAGAISGCPSSDDFNKDGLCGDFINGNDDCLAFCTTIYDRAYHPNIVVPTQIRNLDPAWGTCVPQLEGIYDPPQALTQALVEAKPTAPGASPTAPSATPAPAQSASEQSSPTAAPRLTDGLTTPLPKSTPEPSPQSSPDASTPSAEPESLGSATPAQSGQNTPTPEQSPDPEQSPSPEPVPSPEPSPSLNQPQSPEQSPTAEPSPSQNSPSGNQSPAPQKTEDEPTNPVQNTGNPAQSPSGGDNTANTPAGANSTPSQPSQANQSPNDPSPAQSPDPQPQNAQSQNAASPPDQQPQQGSPTAVIVGGSTFAVGSSANEVTVGSQVLTAGGPAQTIAGQQVSVASNGAIFDGSNTAQQIGAAATQPASPAEATAAALTFTADGRAYTAVPASGASDAYVVDGSQTIQMGSQATVNGVAVSAASDAFVIGGSNTIPVPTSDPSPAADQDAPAVTVSIVSGETNVAVIDGITNSFPQTNGLVNGHIYSWTSGNLFDDIYNFHELGIDLIKLFDFIHRSFDFQWQCDWTDDTNRNLWRQ
ncbi:hypothetical protein PRZ48_011234 [Zasmidium cellare]|uniref:Uncharacterized protein n=1 Tax=Zasmidium cellare TaxID=395010 RepID=A0ABR0EBD8_ZASCE|nr:hypothetical protein PRZ48_011234 [Zasmidium cellare]